MSSNFLSSNDFSHFIFSFQLLQSAYFFLSYRSRVENSSVMTAILRSKPFFIFSISSMRAYSQLPDLGTGPLGNLKNSASDLTFDSRVAILTLRSITASSALARSEDRYFSCSWYFYSIYLKLPLGDVCSARTAEGFCYFALVFYFSRSNSRRLQASRSEFSCSSRAFSLEFSALSCVMSSLLSSRPFDSSFLAILLPVPFLVTSQRSLSLSRRTCVTWKVAELQPVLATEASMLVLRWESLATFSNMSSQSRKCTICSSEILVTMVSRWQVIFHSFLKPASQFSTPSCFSTFTASSSFEALPARSHFLKAVAYPFCSPPSFWRILRSLSSRLISCSMMATSLFTIVLMAGSDCVMSTARRNSAFLSRPEGGRVRRLKPLEAPIELALKPLELLIML